MTTNDDMNPRQPDEDEPIEELLGDVLDLVDETVARITDAEVDEHLRKALSQTGNTEQAASLWLRCLGEATIVKLNCQIGNPAKSPGHDVIADLMATLQGNTRLSPVNAVLLSQRLQQETLDAAHQQAGQIVAAAHDKGLNEAAKMVREAREQADQITGEAREQADQIISEARSKAYQIISSAHSKAGQIVTAARNSQPDRTQEHELRVFVPAACEAGAAQTPYEQDRLSRYLPVTHVSQLLQCLLGGAESPAGDVASPRGETPSDNPATCHIIAAHATDTPVKTGSGNERRSPGATEYLEASLEAILAKFGLCRLPLAGKSSLPRAFRSMVIPVITSNAIQAAAQVNAINAIQVREAPINAIDTSAISALSHTGILGVTRIFAIGYAETAVTGEIIVSHDYTPGGLRWEWHRVEFPDKCAGNEPKLELES